MTVNEIKKAIETLKAEVVANKYTCKQNEKEILTATYSKKADLEKQLATFTEVVERNKARLAKQPAPQPAPETKAQKPVASLKKAPKKAEAPKTEEPKKAVKKAKAEPKKAELFPATYETDKNRMDKVEWDAEKLERGEILVGLYFDVQSISDKYTYSNKETAVNNTLKKMKEAGQTPFPQNIDLYKLVAQNDEVYVLQSIITQSFNGIRKDVLEKAIKNNQIGVYTMTAKEAPKAEPKKAPAKKKATKATK